MVVIDNPSARPYNHTDIACNILGDNMSRTGKILLVMIPLLVVAASDIFGITRVARRLNMLEFYGGYASPIGKYDAIIGDFILDRHFVVDGRLVEVNGDDVYEPSFYLGVSYGQLRSRYFLFSIGFRYTNADLQDTIMFSPTVGMIIPDDYSLALYDIDVNLNYLLADPISSPVSPYFGIGLHSGIVHAKFKGINSDDRVMFALSFNFGVDVKLWSAPKGRSMVTLSSINNWNVVSSDDRPRYLHIGGGIRYWFRP